MDGLSNLLDGKVALITGASRGIGKATALCLAKHGAKLAINAINQELLEQVAGMIQEQGQECVVVPGDISQPDTVERIVESVVTYFGKLDILVNNAGIAIVTPFEQMTLAEWERVMAVNLTGAMLCCQAVIPYMKKAEYGKIVNVSSTAAKWANLHPAPSYGASKAGMLYLTRHLAKAYARDNIYVNAVCPGPVVTEMTDDLTPEQHRQVANSIALGRFGTPDEIAHAILFLCSSLSDFIVGESLNVNGGNRME
jgi:3-oxoacyl-[acyl-carrier protein] reductase